MKTSNSFLQRKKAAIARNGSCYWTYTLTFNLSFCKFNFTRILDNKTASEVAKPLYIYYKERAASEGN